MKRIFFLLTLALGLRGAAPLYAQQPASPLHPEAFKQLTAAEDTLAILAFAVVNDSLEQTRFAACRTLITKLVRALKTENSFRYPFERLKSVSILTPPDSSFRIFTWQLFVNDSTYRYYGAIQRNTRDLQLFPLIDRSFEMDRPLPTRDPLSHEQWYGALYYNIRQFDYKKERKYLLIGYDAFEFFEKRKVVEVLSFDPQSGKPVFGAPVFDRVGEKNAKTPMQDLRIFLQYSAEAGVRLNWDEQYQMILMDHLIPMGSPFAGRGVTHVPDGSYDGLRLEKGRWALISKVFNDAQEEAPTIDPVLSKDKNQDILGRAKKKSKGR